MRTVVAALLPTLFWAGSLLRIPAARRSAPQRTLCASIAAFAAALTLNLPAVYVAFDRAVGVPNLADLGEHLCGVWGVAGILRLARQVTATAPAARVWHELAVPGLATVALTALFVLAPIPAEAPSFTTAYGHLPEIAAYWMVTIAYFGIALAALARLSLRYAGRVRRPSLRIGLQVLGAGVALGVAYSLSKLAELVAAQLPHADAAQQVAATTGHILLAVGALTMSVGLLIPALGPRLRALERAAGRTSRCCACDRCGKRSGEPPPTSCWIRHRPAGETSWPSGSWSPGCIAGSSRSRTDCWPCGPT